MIRLLAAALSATVAHGWWRDEDTHTRGGSPYPYPATHKDGTAPVYNVVNEVDGPQDGKINVHLVPHTHDDTGWLVTVDQYFFQEVYYVVDTVVDQLVKNPKRHFIYVETGFFARWWDEQPDDRRNLTRGLVASGQLEFINGAWCMHDEASPFYTEMIDQTTRGHQFLKKNFGDSAIPRGTWQIDPFGHSNTEAWLLGSEAGFESLFWGRTDYQDMAFRTSAAGKAKNMWPEWVWQGSQSLGKSAELLAGQLTVHGYGAPISWNDEGGAIQDNPSRHDYNADEVVTKFIASAVAMAENQNVGRLSHQLWPCGSDFQYQNADHWFHNLDKIIHYVNYNASKGGPVRAFYSTPSHYTDSKHAATTKQKATWELRSDDVFPLGDNGHAYWTGYFTSRPSLKRQVRLATNFLGAARQMEVLSGVTAAEVDTPTVRPSPPVGASWTDSLEGTIGVATHHDGMSGTEKQAVADDYSQRISESHFEVEAGVAKSLQKIAGISGEVGHCNCNTAGNCLNMSVCGYTTGVDSFTVIAWNPLGQNTTSWLRLPVSGASWTVTNLATKQVVPSQATVIDNRTKTLPLLYLRAWPHPDPEAVATHENKATHLVNFAAALPPVGYTSFSVKKAAATAAAAVQPANHATPPWVSNGFYNITLNHAAGLIDTITNLKSGVSQKINITFGYYEASEGGCTKEPHGAKDQCSSQASGAYMFRPAQQYTHSCDNTTQPTLEVTQGPLITEIKTVFADWATHVIRLQKDSQYISVEWTAGPIPREAYPGAKPPAPKPGPGGCVGWRQTSGCNAHGTLEPENNKPCSAKISQSGESGFCLCANDTKIYGSQCGAPSGDAGDTCAEICNKPYQPDPHKGFSGKEIVLKFNSDIDSAGAWYADANGREMVKRRRNARGPSYPPYQIGEPVAGNYYPVNSLTSLDDGKIEMAVVTDVSMGGSSITDGSLEVMVHRRLLADDHRGVGEPLDETMCGGSGFGDCAGLTMRGTAFLVLDTVANAHAARRELVETLNFPPTLAFTKSAAVATPSMSALGAALPPNVKLMTIANNYAAWNGGKLLLRFAHKYQAGEHPVLSQPASFSLATVFSKAGLKVASAQETTLTGNQERASWEAKKLSWPTEEVVDRGMSAAPQEQRHFLDPSDAAMQVTINAMEVKTYLVTLE